MSNGEKPNYRHVEAFCLMWYACVLKPGGPKNARMSISNGCGHRELIWNSRDGVTPFGTECPSCGGDLCHTDFPRDLRAPSYKPQHGQRVWTGMTREVAAKFAQIRLEGTEAYYREHPDEAPAIKLTLEELTEEIYGDGLPPMLVIAGYDYGN